MPIAAAVLATVFAYAALRYVVLGTVAASQLPLYILDKAVAVAAIVLVAIALAIGPAVRLGLAPRRWIALRKSIGGQAFLLAAAHALISVALLSPRYHAKLHDASGWLTATGGVVVLAGVIALGTLVGPAVTSVAFVRRSMASPEWRRIQRMSIFALAIALAHVAVLGWRSWLAPETWPGGLPPLTAIAAVIAAASLGLRAAAWMAAHPGRVVITYLRST